MGLFISLWTFFSLGNFQENIFPHAYQYAVILICMLGIAFNPESKKVNQCRAFYGMIFWLFFYTSIAIVNDGGVVHCFEKLFIYGMTVFCCLRMAVFCDVKYILKHVLLGTSGILIVSLMLIFLYPKIGIEQDKFIGSWRGVFEQKNALGRVCTIAVFCLCYILVYGGLNKYQKFLFPIIAIFIFIVCFKTESRTSFAICIVNIIAILFSWLLHAVLKRKSSFLKNTAFLLSSIFLWILFSLIISFAKPYGIHSGYDGISIWGTEISLTGRLTIWYYAISNTLENHPWFGFGLDNFWTNTNFYRFGEMIGMGSFYPNDSHNGLVDLFVQTGVVGVIFYMFFLLVPLFLCNKINSRTMSIFFCMLIFYVFSNMTESYVTKSTNILNTMMIVFWLKPFLFTKNIKDMIYK